MAEQPNILFVYGKTPRQYLPSFQLRYFDGPPSLVLSATATLSWTRYPDSGRCCHLNMIPLATSLIRCQLKCLLGQPCDEIIRPLLGGLPRGHLHSVLPGPSSLFGLWGEPFTERQFIEKQITALRRFLPYWITCRVYGVQKDALIVNDISAFTLAMTDVLLQLVSKSHFLSGEAVIGSNQTTATVDSTAWVCGRVRHESYQRMTPMFKTMHFMNIGFPWKRRAQIEVQRDGCPISPRIFTPT